jgi:hypothetical protein
MNTVAGSRKEKESGLAPTSLAETKWPVEKPEIHALGEWIELGRKLRSASDEEILSLMGSVAMYLKDKLKDETFPSTDYNYREYVRGYANTILKAAQAEHAKRHSERLG